MTPFNDDERGSRGERRWMRSLAALAALLFYAAPASALPDLRRSRTAGPLTVYSDDARPNVFYYPPGDLAVATREDGSPDVHLLLARYTGSVATHDQGRALYRSVLTVHVVLGGRRLRRLGRLGRPPGDDRVRRERAARLRHGRRLARRHTRCS